MPRSDSEMKVELPMLLPELTDARDHCVRTLIRMLRSHDGVFAAHVDSTAADGTPRLCLHFDSGELSVSRVRELMLAAGARITARIGHWSGTLSPAPHARAASTLAAQLRRTPGVLEADVSSSGTLRIEFDRKRADTNAIARFLASRGFKPADAGRQDNGASEGAAQEPRSQRESRTPQIVEKEHDHEPGHAHGHGHGHGALLGEHGELIFSIASGLVLFAGWVVSRAGLGPPWLATTLYAVAIGFGGWFTAREAIDNLRAGRFEIDTLMLVAAAGAMTIGAWAEAALLLFLFSLGHALEHWAMGRAKRAIEALAKLAPEVAVRRRGDQTEEAPVASLEVGDVVLVRPNERLPADGLVIAGTSSVNQAPITGESVPVDKRAIADPQATGMRLESIPAEHRVFAGTINGAGALEVRVARIAAESTLARVVQLVTEAEARQSPTQRFTARFERIFVPTVLALSGLLLFAWLVIDEPFSQSFYRSMAVLVAASPCALAISVPSAVLSGVARAARSGILIKGGAALEELGALTAIAFDKTGTLTEGKPRLTDIEAAAGVSHEQLLRVAAALERQSDHPLARAIVAGADRALESPSTAPAVTNVRSVTGRGITGVLEGEPVTIGKRAMFTEGAGTDAFPAEIGTAESRLADAGRSTMVVRHGDRFLGVLGVMDTPRPQTATAMRELRSLGIARLIMISGDNQRVADAVAAEVGLTEARGDMMPEDKVSTILALRAELGKVAMVGDGVNDAPAMANATVGIAMGAAGSDVALEAADVALMSDDVARLPFAVALGRQTRRIILQNLWVSLGVVAVLVPATIFGLSIGLAVLAHEGSTLVVVINALRLLRFAGEDRLSPIPPGLSRP